MRKCLLLAAVCGTLLAGAAAARDDRLLYPIEDALQRPEAQDRLDQTVQFYFGDTPYPQEEEDFGAFDASRKTNSLNKTDLFACDWTFLSALLSLRDRAKDEGGNAVVDIVSTWKNREFSSRAEYECRAGDIVAGVGLRGRVVRLPEKR
jgi:hypothetical protein